MIFADRVEEALVTGAHYDQLAANYHLSPEKLESDYAAVRFARELRVFSEFCRAGQVLDVGCSTGAFLHQLQIRWPGTYAGLGMDVAEAALDQAAARGVAVLRQPFLEYDFGETRFDAITFWAVLEHLVKPKPFLNKAATLLKAGGVCFILVPNAQSLAVRLLGARYRYLMPEHVNWFAPATLRAFAAREPTLETVFLRSTHFNPVVIWQDFWRRREAVPEAERARLLKRTTRWKQSRLLKPLAPCYCVVEQMLGAAWLADNLVIVLRKRYAD